MLQRSSYGSNATQIDNVIRDCKTLGTEYVFTSLQLENSKLDNIQPFVDEGIKVIVDVSKSVLEEEASFDDLSRIGDVIFRLDDGYTMEEMIRLSENHRVAVNASALNEEAIYKLGKSARTDNITAMFNYYPKELTGMSRMHVEEQATLFKREGIKVFAFIPGTEILRRPMYRGLPTVEDHRYRNVLANYLEMKNHFGIDEVFLGDEHLTEKEIRDFKRLFKHHLFTMEVEDIANEQLFQELNNFKLQRRPDISPYLIRFSSTRGKLDQFFSNMESELVSEFHPGDIIMDNMSATRYGGELQFARRYAKVKDKYIRVGKLKDSDLLSWIEESHIIKFEWE